MAQSGDHGRARFLTYRKRNTTRGRDHPSYNVAKKVLEWEFKEEIPRSRLRAAYGEGFKGAPLRCEQLGEEAFSRDKTAHDAQACSQKAPAIGGLYHV